MWQNRKFILLLGSTVSAAAFLWIRRAFLRSKVSLFIVQDPSLIGSVGHLETLIGSVNLLQRVPGVPIFMKSSLPGQFDCEKLIRTRSIGVSKYAGNILYSPTTTSTNVILQTCDCHLGFPDVSQGLVYICDEQTQGKGRTGAWVSNRGCLMFTYKFSCEVKYALPVQMIIPLAIVLAVVRIWSNAQESEYAKSHVRVKWPNDVFLGKMKIGGVLVDSESKAGMILMNIGIGLNVDNEHPTTCLNASKSVISRESLLIEFFDCFEELIVQLKTKGEERIREMYVERWYHKDAKAVYSPTGEQIVLVDVDLSAGIIAKRRNGEKIMIQKREDVEFGG